MKDIKVVAFDCDGVMFDTEDANKAYYNKILTRFGKPRITKKQFEYAQMHTADESISYLFENKETYEAAQAYRKTLSYYPFIKYMVIEPHLKSILKWLGTFSKTAIATNRTDTMSGVLKEFTLEEYFELVVTALDVAHPKPHPESLQKILHHFNAEPHQAIYIGDSKLDELAATSAGIPLIAYNNQNLSADYHIKSLKELKQILA